MNYLLLSMQDFYLMSLQTMSDSGFHQLQLLVDCPYEFAWVIDENSKWTCFPYNLFYVGWYRMAKY